MEDGAQSHREHVHLFDEAVPVSEIRKRLNVAGSKQWLMFGIVAQDPFGVERPRVGRGERSVLVQTFSFRVEQLGRNCASPTHHIRGASHSKLSRDLP